MIKCKCDKPYPEIMVECKNPEYAKILMKDYAGFGGEQTAIHQYSFQHFVTFNSCNQQDFSDIIEEISRIEMKHFELLGKTICALGVTPIYATYMNNNRCTYWNSCDVAYETDVEKMLKKNIDAESNAIKQYEYHKSIICDKYIKQLISRIIEDEKVHLEIFNMLLKHYNC